MSRAVHRVPAVVEQLGTLLDLTVSSGDHRMRIDDWKGWLLLAPPDAFERKAGQGRLYLVKGKLGADFDEERALQILRNAGDTYAKWHKREHERVRALNVADGVGILIGRAERIGYRSDKWGRRGKTHDYDHDFRERGGVPPKVWCDSPHAGKARTAVITGGDFVVRQEGIS